jgi:threonine dehydrogenase-like Zn-dependent dehydrogenase
MKAVIRRGRALIVDDMPDPIAGKGQTLVKTLACGICGSDLHNLSDLEHVADTARRAGAGDGINAARDMVFGHEYCAEILEHGAETTGKLMPGTRVVAMPFVAVDGRMEWVGISNVVPGGFAQRMVLTEALLLEVPNGLPTDHAALVEPMAVGAHAVAEARLAPGTVALVLGCGPVGLAVIASLKLNGHGPIVAADFSPKRREIAAIMGADVVVDPAVDSPNARWEEFGVAPNIIAHTAWAMAGRISRPAVAFECVGAPGLIQSLIDNVPPGAQIIVAGACMKPDLIQPMIAINKQLALRFVCAYSSDEFARTLHDIAEGRIDVSPMVTGHVGIDGVAEAFERLANSGQDVKILVEPNP